MLMWGELFDEFRDKLRRGATTRPRPENPDHHPWRHSTLAMVGLQPQELAIPVCAILELFREHRGRITLRLVRQPLGLSLHSRIIPSGVMVLLPGAKYNSTAAVWANLLGGGRRVIRWQRQPRANSPNQSTPGTWIRGASLLEPGLLLEMLQTVLSISVGHVYLDVAHARDPFGIGAWWRPLWNALRDAGHVDETEPPQTAGGYLPAQHTQHIIPETGMGMVYRKLKHKLQGRGVNVQTPIHVVVVSNAIPCVFQRGEVYRLTIMPHCANVGVRRILRDHGTERACSDMPRKEVLRLLHSGVLKYIDYWIPGLLGGFWDALPTDEAHAVCPCSEHESSGDPKEDCELGMKQWAVQHGGPIDPPPDALWQELVSHHLGSGDFVSPQLTSVQALQPN